ncbi:hypothetical protein PV10_04209 [Exophiala mesophila]|uniref:Zn(2)-C6 fungal-type domain-containing protein n=1 Tax=Exophiala mesophila TaxID=212818 RepID=A0A0D2A1R0_EXOME|nr:uncharacterized protein PV10_04209 [Exophiala mesophila]KIV92958.1 hypothetical protein PV10_04209 [Exophiala mesophila]
MSRLTVSKACDACRRRKVRCNLARPCVACRQADLECTFLSTRLKKGRTGESANVLAELRKSQSNGESNDFTPSTPAQFQALNYTSPTFSLDLQTSPHSIELLPGRQLFQRNLDLLPLALVELCAEVFLTQLASTVPVLNVAAFRHMVSARGVDGLGEEEYCYACSFCAFVLLQTDSLTNKRLVSLGIARHAAIQGQLLLKEALSARSHLDLLAPPSLRTVVLAFFIYGCHSALGRHRLAWFFLREATTMYTSATMDIEDPAKDETFSRLFWLLLISERSHAIRRRRPITLQITPQSPSINDTTKQSPGLVGFGYLAELFESVDDNFIALWNRASSTESSSDLVQLEEKICKVIPDLLDIAESQVSNIRVSQQWLRMIIWQLCTMLGFLSSEADHESLTFRYPLRISRDLAMLTWKLPVHSMQVHGMGLTEKVFDIAFTLIDVISCIPIAEARSSGFEVGPEDNLKHFLSLIAQLPGGKGKYLPLLVSKVEQSLPGMAAPIMRHVAPEGDPRQEELALDA